MENSFWIKDLNRDGANFNKFAEYVKEKYRLRVSDKVSDAIDNVDIQDVGMNLACQHYGYSNKNQNHGISGRNSRASPARRIFPLTDQII